MRRGTWLCLGALVFCLVTSAAGMRADAQLDTNPTPDTTTTAPPATTPPAPTTTTTTARATTTTTTKAAPSTTTAVTRSGAPIPPPASGPSQTLVPDLLGGPLDLETTTTTMAAPRADAPTTLPATAARTTPIAAHGNGANGLTLVLASIAWLASLAGLLVYAEDRRSLRWKHLAR